MSAVLQCLHIPTILLKGLSFFQSNSFDLKWPVVNFHTFGGSNKAQISIFGVKYLRDPHLKELSSWRGPILPKKFVLGGLFDPNKVQETHLDSF